jgi:hypothetical protein
MLMVCREGRGVWCVFFIRFLEIFDVGALSIRASSVYILLKPPKQRIEREQSSLGYNTCEFCTCGCGYWEVGGVYLGAGPWRPLLGVGVEVKGISIRYRYYKCKDMLIIYKIY